MNAAAELGDESGLRQVLKLTDSVSERLVPNELTRRQETGGSGWQTVRGSQSDLSSFPRMRPVVIPAQAACRHSRAGGNPGLR